ncbi:MAG: hypothetical protein HQL15_06295 [Candidatus Omnitrophica bacterium]|nr:hypothetical protein [Candidatus Omnitrophota bacterium]
MAGNVNPIKVSNIVYGVLLLLIGIVYYWTAQFGFIFAWQHSNVTAVCPSSSLGFIVIFALGYRFWPGIWLGDFLVNAYYFLSTHSLNISQIIG